MRAVFFSRRWLGVHVIVIIAVLVMLRLGLWQWHRAESPSGGLQNYAYAFQWPLFAVFALGLWWKSMRIEADNAAAAEAGLAPKETAFSRLNAAPLPEAEIQHRNGVRIGLSTDLTVGDDEDEEVRLYNAYLAQLNARVPSRRPATSQSAGN